MTADLVVVDPHTPFTCAGCGRDDGHLLTMDDAGPLCLTCADLDGLVFLARGDATLSRRARAGSRLSAVVVRWSRTRRRYERQGVLVEPAALERAEASCLADEDVRELRRVRDRERRERHDEAFVERMTAEIARLFPRCPRDRVQAIAAHTAERGSGRVGRSAAGRALERRAVEAAVVASARHEDTGYDALLMAGVPREEARARILGELDTVLTRWRGESATG